MPGRVLVPLFAVLLAGCVAMGPGVSVPATPRTDAPSMPPPSPTPPRPTEATPAASRSPSPTTTAVPSPTPPEDPSRLELRTTSCDGGVVLEWSPSRHPDFHHYSALRSPEREIDPAYPPIAPAVDWGDTYTTDPFVTSGFDASIVPSSTTWHYRVVAYDAADRVVSASPVRPGRLSAVDVLAPLEITALDDGRVGLRWGAYGGFSRCFSSYRVLYGSGPVPTSLLGTVSGQARTELVTGALHPGTSYAFRVQAVRTTTMGAFVVGETDVRVYAVPGH